MADESNQIHLLGTRTEDLLYEDALAAAEAVLYPQSEDNVANVTKKLEDALEALFIGVKFSVQAKDEAIPSESFYPFDIGIDIESQGEGIRELFTSKPYKLVEFCEDALNDEKDCLPTQVRLYYARHVLRHRLPTPRLQAEAILNEAVQAVKNIEAVRRDIYATTAYLTLAREFSADIHFSGFIQRQQSGEVEPTKDRIKLIEKFDDLVAAEGVSWKSQYRTEEEVVWDLLKAYTKSTLKTSLALQARIAFVMERITPRTTAQIEGSFQRQLDDKTMQELYLLLSTVNSYRMLRGLGFQNYRATIPVVLGIWGEKMSGSMAITRADLEFVSTRYREVIAYLKSKINEALPDVNCDIAEFFGDALIREWDMMMSEVTDEQLALITTVERSRDQNRGIENFEHAFPVLAEHMLSKFELAYQGN